jgi:hypothetical protein
LTTPLSILLVVLSLASSIGADSISGKETTISVAPPADARPRKMAPDDLVCSSGILALKIDGQPPMPWPGAGTRLKTIEGLDPRASHDVVVLCEGLPRQSFRFRFSNFQSRDLCLFINERDGTAKLWNRSQSPWCQHVSMHIDRSSLDVLTNRSGWIPLGDLSADRTQWASGSDPTVPFKTGRFEILGKTVDRRRPVLPRIGDRIRLPASVPVMILDYATTGEKRAFESPASPRRRLDDSDRTEILLPAGTVLLVREVTVGAPAGGMRTAWARVSPGE